MTYLKTSSSTDIQQAFSGAAKHYDKLSGFHQKYALRMVEEIRSLNLSRILDVGCGTSYLSGKMKQKFPQSEIIGLDFSEGMIEQARSNQKDINFVLADASQIPFPENYFDLVVSNFAYQWMPDLTKAFSEARRVLAPNGQFTATLFGYQTCEELFNSLEEAGFRTEELNRFATVGELQVFLDNACFSGFQVEPELNKLAFENLWQLLAWLKAIGANKLSAGQFLGPKQLERAQGFAKQHYSYQGQVLITFEIIKIKAIK